MTLETISGVVRFLLLANSSVFNLVNSRIYAGELPLNCSFPAISIYKPSNPYSRVAGSPRVQVSCWAYDPLQVQRLAKAVEQALDGYSGIVEGIEVIRIVPLDAPDLPKDPAGLYQIPYDFTVIYRK